MDQPELLRKCADFIFGLRPHPFQDVTKVAVEPVYTIRFDQGRDDWVRVRCIPGPIEFERASRSSVKRIISIDVVALGKLRHEQDVDIFQKAFSRLASIFLIVNPFESASCLNASTVDGADGMYDREELESTPTVYYGGIRLAFWTYEKLDIEDYYFQPK